MSGELKHNKQYFINGNICREYFTLNGNFHNPDGPADISYYENGNKQCECFYLKSKLHNANGPAIITYFKNGIIRTQEYFFNGKKLLNIYSNEELQKYIKLINIK